MDLVAEFIARNESVSDGIKMNVDGKSDGNLEMDAVNTNSSLGNEHDKVNSCERRNAQTENSVETEKIMMNLDESENSLSVAILHTDSAAESSEAECSDPGSVGNVPATVSDDDEYENTVASNISKSIEHDTSLAQVQVNGDGKVTEICNRSDLVSDNPSGLPSSDSSMEEPANPTGILNLDVSGEDQLNLAIIPSANGSMEEPANPTGLPSSGSSMEEPANPTGILNLDGSGVDQLNLSIILSADGSMEELANPTGLPSSGSSMEEPANPAGILNLDGSGVDQLSLSVIPSAVG